MDIVSALILGLIQGITEFLPVSSSGHLVLAREFLAVDVANGLALDGVLHLATTLAVIIYFRSDLFVLLQALVRKLGRLPTNEKDLVVLYALAAGTVPAVIAGLLLEDVIAKNAQSMVTVAVFLFLAALFFMYAEWRYYLAPPHGTITVRRGLMVGLFQALALLPGFSRSGSTLAGGMLLGMSRLEAARFSFLLAIPITLAVGLKSLFELLVLKETVSWFPVLVGAVVSFVVALVVIHFFLAFIRRYTLWPFIWYTIVLSLLIGYVAVFV